VPSMEGKRSRRGLLHRSRPIPVCAGTPDLPAPVATADRNHHDRPDRIEELRVRIPVADGRGAIGPRAWRIGPGFGYQRPVWSAVEFRLYGDRIIELRHAGC